MGQLQATLGVRCIPQRCRVTDTGHPLLVQPLPEDPDPQAGLRQGATPSTQRVEHPGSSRSEIRQILCARLFHMIDQFPADIFQADPEIKILAAFRRWDEETTKSALGPNSNKHSFFQRANDSAHLTDWATKVSTSMDQHFICRKVTCRAVVDNRCSLQDLHGKFYCPECLTQYRPWFQALDLIPAQKALVVAVQGLRPFATRAQLLETTQASWSTGVPARPRPLPHGMGKVGRASPRMGDLEDAAGKNQPLPYFRRETWSAQTMTEIFHRNVAANPPYRLDLLPTVVRPGRFSDASRNTQQHFAAYTMDSYFMDPPFYDATHYEFVPKQAVVMSQNDCCRFLALSCPRGWPAELRAEAIQDLDRDQSANNTRATGESRWGLWLRLAQQYQLPPLPLTIELVSAIGVPQGRGLSPQGVCSRFQLMLNNISSRPFGASREASDHQH